MSNYSLYYNDPMSYKILQPYTYVYEVLKLKNMRKQSQPIYFFAKHNLLWYNHNFILKNFNRKLKLKFKYNVYNEKFIDISKV